MGFLATIIATWKHRLIDSRIDQSKPLDKTGIIRFGLITLAAMTTLAPTAAPAQAKQDMHVDDFARVEYISQPTFDAAGERVAYVLSKKKPDKDERYDEIWISDWASGKSQQLTNTRENDESQPRFSADGRYLYFLSDETVKQHQAKPKASSTGAEDSAEDEDDAQTQLWRQDIDSGARKPITAVKGGISDYALSPDNKFVAVIAAVGSRVDVDADKDPPIVVDRFIFKQDGSGYLDDRQDHVFIVDIGSGAQRQISTGDADFSTPRWSPDGTSIAVIRKGRTDREDRSPATELVTLSVRDSAARKLVALGNSIHTLEWSPDGMRIAFIDSEPKWGIYAQSTLGIVDAKNGKVSRPLQLDNWISDPIWSADGRELMALI